MSEPVVRDRVGTPDDRSARRMAGIGIMGGWPTAYVLEKLGVELRRLYAPFTEEPLPDHLKNLALRLES